MTDDISNDVYSILKEYTEEEVSVIDDASVLNELGIDSLGIIEIIYDLEEKFNITIPDPRDLVTEGTGFSTAGGIVAAVSKLIKEQR